MKWLKNAGWLLFGLLQMPVSASLQWLQSGETQQKHYQLSLQGEILYQTTFQIDDEKLLQQIQLGHTSQLGKLELSEQQVIASGPNGSILWQDQRQLPLCLPELFGEFIRLNQAALLAGATIDCEGPILKAKKLAPFQISLQQKNGNRLTFVVKPGSLGMWFFMDPIFLDTDLQVQRILRYQGVWPAPQGQSGKMQYLETEWSNPQGIAITDFFHPALLKRSED